MNPIRQNGAFTSFTQTIISSIVLSVIVFMVVMNQPSEIQTPIVPQNNVTLTDVESFNFHIHCPLKSRKEGGFVELMNHLQINNTDLILKIEAQLSVIDTYAVFERVSTINPQNRSSEMQMSYCGWAKLLNETNCSNARFVCTIPGPMFKVAAGTQTAVIWVNQINGPDLDWSYQQDNCYDPSNQQSQCWLRAKQSHNQSCTFNSPTDIDLNLTKLVRISPTSAPISVHVHGIQNRPSFDGNPQSWFDNAGNKGLGYFSASTNDYFTLFNNSLTFWPGLLTSSQQESIKVNFYSHNQSPGFCFYHDHAMRATLFNTMKGSVGFYLIYDESIERGLPKDEEDVIFIMHFHNQGDIRQYGKESLSNITGEFYMPPVGDNLFVSKKSHIYRNMTYRFRFINGHFDDFYSNISFAIFYQTQTLSNGSVIYKEVEPPLTSDSNFFKKNMHVLTFTAIAADNSLFKTTIHNLDQFSLAAAERFELLIKFDTVPINIMNVYVVCFDAEAVFPFVVKYVFKFSKSSVENKYKNPNEFNSFNVPYTDFSLIPNTSVTQYRMRALFSRPIQQVFSISLHPFFGQAASQNPKIGTVQDWFIINTTPESHPIHIHIINFQIIEELTLKTIPEGCTLYQLDYFRQSNISNFLIQDNAALCAYLNNLTTDIMDGLWPAFHSYLLQNVSVSTDIGVVSGKNVLQKMSNSTNQTKYSLTGCPLNSVFKYICSNSSANIYPWYKQWKDTGQMKGQTVTRVRIRWAKNSYNSSQSAYPFFNFPQDQLIEFPGSLYHCHILPHEQNMMMRPIMLQPSDAYLALAAVSNTSSNLGVCSGKNWAQNLQCITNSLQC